MSLNYSYKHDISYANYNNSNLPWKINSSYIYHNNQRINSSLNLGPINNNLVIESSQNNIILITPQNNKHVVVNNNMTINNDLDISNILKTNFINANDLCLNGILHTGLLTIIGSINLRGTFTYQGGVTDASASSTRFREVNFNNSMFYDSSINNSDVLTSDFSNMNIFNTYIYNNPIGYDKSNNSNPAKAVFSDVTLYSLVLDTSLNSKCYIKFSNSNSNSNSNYNTPIIIKSSDDYSKLEISKPLNIGLSFEETVTNITNISNISVFYGDISCEKLYYSQLYPDVKLNNYFDVSIGEVSVSGNSIPSLANRFNIGSNNLKFNEINSAKFSGFLDGSCTIANDLIKNLDMSFNTLDIYGIFKLNDSNLAQFLSSDFVTISKGITDFSNANRVLSDLSISLYSKAGFDLCLNTNIAKNSLRDASLLVLNNNITSISNSVYSKSDFDLCLNRNLIRTNDVSAVVSVVTDPLRIYSRLGYIDSSLNKVNSAKVSDELVFPYAITYIDDNVEDTNLKEAYSYTMTTVTYGPEDTFRYDTVYRYDPIYRYDTVYRYDPVYTITYAPVAGAEPNNINEKHVVMWNASSSDPEYKNTWIDIQGQLGAFERPAVYVRWPSTWIVNNDRDTWENHNNIAATRNCILAVILTAAEAAEVGYLAYRNGRAWIGGKRRDDRQTENPRDKTGSNWEWVTGPSTNIGDAWDYQNFASNEPKSFSGTRAVVNTNGTWADNDPTLLNIGIYMQRLPSSSAQIDATHYKISSTITNWVNHDTRVRPYYGYNLAYIENEAQNNMVGTLIVNSGLDALYKGSSGVYIGGKRTSNSTDPYGITSADWEWSNGSKSWSYSKFFRGGMKTEVSRTQTGTTAVPIGTTPVEIGTTAVPIGTTPVKTGTISVIKSSNNAPVTTSIAKLPNIVSSNNGSVVVTCTPISSDIPNYLEIITDQYTKTTYTYVRNANNGLTTGSFKISDNSNNNSNYVSPFSVNSIPTSYSCIAITNDGMFVALGKASDVTVYIRNSNGWTTIGSSISVNFSAYTETSVGIIPTQYTDINWRKNLQNLAINYNYNNGLTNSQLILAFGDTRNIIKVYSYSGGTWSFSNGFYSVAGGSWGSNPLTSYSASVLGVSTNTNFGYFVTLSQSPSVLGFSVDDKFYTYNCTTTLNTPRGSRQTLDASYNNYKNIIAFKMSSDAEKIIVSNTYYVFIYNWSTTNWNIVKTINYVSSAITFTYPNTSTTRIPAGPRSLDISNISTNDCVFAIGFPDVLIDTSANRKVRGYVEYWKLTNSTLTNSSLTRLATLMPRKRDFNNSSVDSDEYFFSAGGIKITNANTIIVAPNFKFHFNSTAKKYELDPQNDSWTTHNSRASSSRFFASIQNEVENELVKISARNNSVWIGGKRVTNPPTPNDGRGKTSIDWQWINVDAWNYQNFAINEPNTLGDQGVQFSNSGWTDLGFNNNRQAIFMTLSTTYTLRNSFTIFNNFFFHSSGFSSSYFPTDISTTVIARWYSRDTSLNPTNTNTIHFTAGGRIVSLTRNILTLSDIRLKENIVDATPKLEDLLKVRVVNYSLKGSNGAKLIGVVAQELEELFPSLVNDGLLSIQDINLGKTESYKSVKYSCFDVILIKAFQEQMAIINKLSLRLDELESKTNLLKTIYKDYLVLNEELDFLKRENELIKLTINEITKLIS